LVEFYICERLQLIRAVSSTSKKNVIACATFLDMYSVLRREKKRKENEAIILGFEQTDRLFSSHYILNN
jgi:hypothetical protein